MHRALVTLHKGGRADYVISAPMNYRTIYLLEELTRPHTIIKAYDYNPYVQSMKGFGYIVWP